MDEQTTQQVECPSKPELIYHYTDQKGLLGILESKRIWATHIRYLNDKSEGKILSSLLSRELKDRVANSAKGSYSNLEMLMALSKNESGEAYIKPSLSEKLILEAVCEMFELTLEDTYVASFTKKLGDQLSQWRSYSGKNCGYSLGFTRSYLNAIGLNFISAASGFFHDDPTPLVDCLYCEEEEEALKKSVQETVDACISGGKNIQPENHVPTRDEICELYKQQLEKLLPYSRLYAQVKHIGFREEDECRLVFHRNKFHPLTRSELKFRPGASMPTPYFEVDLAFQDQPIEVSEIIVGPCPHPDEAVNVVKLLLKKNGIHLENVNKSNIPYRSW